MPLTSLVYVFRHKDGFLVALHVPQHDNEWTEELLRCVVVSAAMVIPESDFHAPIVVLHWVHGRAELTLVNLGPPAVYKSLKSKADAPDGLQYFTNLVIATIANTPQFETQVKCGLVTLTYNDIEDVANASETASYAAPSLVQVDARFLDFCRQ